jgi:hypothetical protein
MCDEPDIHTQKEKEERQTQNTQPFRGVPKDKNTKDKIQNAKKTKYKKTKHAKDKTTALKKLTGPKKKRSIIIYNKPSVDLKPYAINHQPSRIR